MRVDGRNIVCWRRSGVLLRKRDKRGRKRRGGGGGGRRRRRRGRDSKDSLFTKIKDFRVGVGGEGGRGRGGGGGGGGVGRRIMDSKVILSENDFEVVL